MEIKIIFGILIGTIFINNFVLSQILGLCPFLGVSKKLDSALGMGLAVTFVMTIASFMTFIFYKYILLPFDIVYLKTVAFILIIASLVQFVEMIIEKVSPVLYNSLGIFLPLITTNCALLGVAVLNINSGFITSEFGLVKSVVQGFGGGVGFTLALLIMAGIRERLELADIPENLKGLPITFITAGLLALAFLGFAGMKI
ncbi:MAG: electron transport complex subunit RsxA [Leptospirales bacterium]|nr:electron transport complex subunit RsxA [Leptospirales bacterium]